VYEVSGGRLSGIRRRSEIRVLAEEKAEQARSR